MNLVLNLEEDAASVPMARLLGKTMLEKSHVAPETVEAVELIVGELCTNVIRHARSTEGHYRVTFEFDERRVVVTVEDRGDGFLSDDVLPPGTSRSCLGVGQERVGGFGLGLVEAMADRVEFFPAEPQGTLVRAEKRLR